MLFGEKKYIIEFCQAAVKSFQEYGEHYEKYLLSRDEANLRKAGHKIKPVAQMLKLNNLLEEYEGAKLMLQTDVEEYLLRESNERVQDEIRIVIKELEEIIAEQ
jgi:hypothetical protein